MPRRTLTYASLAIREQYVAESHFILDDINGVSLIDEFESWLTAVKDDHFDERPKQKYGKKPVVERRNRLVLVSMRTGNYGTAGNEVIDVSNHSTSYATKLLDASTVETRCGLLVPPGGKTALFFVEHEGHQNCGFRILESFKGHLADLAHRTMHGRKGTALRLKFDQEMVVSGDAWLKNAQLQALTVHFYSRPTDISDDGIPQLDLAYSQTLAPVKGAKWLPKSLKDLIFTKKVTSASALGFPVDGDYDSLVAKLTDGDRSKSIEVSNPRMPSIRTILNDDGEEHLSMSELVSTIDEEANWYYTIERLSFDYSWTRVDPT